MELGEKIQELRKSKNMTQEQLAQALFVSRTAISKWESNRGYPSIDSLKALSQFFHVSLDDLLSTETVLHIVDEKEENRKNTIFGILDVISILLIFLPLYPKKVQGVIYAVNLFEYESIFKSIYIILFSVCMIVGILQLVFKRKKLRYVSLFLSIVLICILIFTRQTYAGFLCFILFLMKVLVLR